MTDALWLVATASPRFGAFSAQHEVRSPSAPPDGLLLIFK